jgi:putative transcription factor
MAKGLKQTELAAMIAEKSTVINEYESGRAIPNGALIAKIERALGAKLPRPPKKK